MDVSEVEWVDEAEWAALEAAMAAAVQQRNAKRCKAETKDHTRSSECSPTWLTTSIEKTTALVADCSGPLGIAAQVKHALVSVSSAPSVPSSQQEFPETMSLSDWVASQKEFPGFWPEAGTTGIDGVTAGANATTAGTDSVTGGKACRASGSERCREHNGNGPRAGSHGKNGNAASGQNTALAFPCLHTAKVGPALQKCSATSVNNLRDSPNADILAPPQKAHHIRPPTGPSKPMPEAPEQPHSVQDEPKKERQLPTWLTSARPSTAPQECTLPIMRFGGQVYYAVSPPEVDAAARSLLEGLRGGEACLGFDIEWKVTFQRGETPRKAALIQLCPSGTCCYLFHIAHSGLTSSLRALLEEGSIGKAGAGIYGDAQKLRRDFGVAVSGLRDLGDLANERLQPKEGPRKWSLTALAQEVMLMQVEKPPKQRISDWERLPLTADQRHYAATDAYASLRLYQVLMSLPAPPPRPILRPLPQSELNSLECPGLSPGQDLPPELWVPAASETVYLAPSKLDVHKMHLEGLTVAEITERKRVRVTTIEGYLVEAMQAGLAYGWHLLGVSEPVRERVEDAVRAELDAQEAESREEESGSGGSASDGTGVSERVKERIESGVRAGCGPPEGDGSVGLDANKGRASGWTRQGSETNPVLESLINHASRVRPAVTSASGAVTSEHTQGHSRPSDESAPLDPTPRERVSANPDRLVEVVTAARLAGLKLKAVMDRIPPDESVTFSHVRFVIAHLARRADAGLRQRKRIQLCRSAQSNS